MQLVVSMVAADAGNHTTAFAVRSAGETRDELPCIKRHADICIQKTTCSTKYVKL
jgi:hypothetical protein